MDNPSLVVERTPEGPMDSVAASGHVRSADGLRCAGDELVESVRDVVAGEHYEASLVP